MSQIKFYLDENMDIEIAEQLRRKGIAVVTVRELGTLGDSDENHLKQASEMGHVLCTQDRDFLRLHTEGFTHIGIVFGEHFQSTIGGWVRALQGLHTTTTSEEMIGQVRFLRVK